MNKLNSLEQFNIKEGEMNFLIGIAGNGLSTKIQKEIYSESHEDLYYLNYINFPSISESAVLFEFADKIVRSISGIIMSMGDIVESDIPFNIFQHVANIVKENSEKEVNMTIVLDEFYRMLDFSNSFYYTLAKLLSLGKVFSNIKITSIFISDKYINPADELYNESLNQMFLVNNNFDIVPALTYEELINNNVNPFKDKFDKETHKRIYALSGGNPSIAISIVKLLETKPSIKNEELLTSHGIEWTLEEIWKTLGKSNQLLFTKIVNNEVIKVDSSLQKKYLSKTGLIDLPTNQSRIRLLQLYVKQKQASNIDTDENEGYLTVGTQTIFLPDLPPQIEKILMLLYTNKNQLVTRDQIAEVIWGEQYLNNYSESAIDKQISELRKILSGPSKTNKVLETKKGKGYLLNA